MDLLPPNASPLRIYRQTKQVLKNTSRANNADWYKPAGELNLQWHIWVGAYSVSSAIFNLSLNSWYEGPVLPQISLDRDENGNPSGLDEPSRNAVHDLLRRILATREFGVKATSLGITFHLADALRVRDLAPDFSIDEDFEGLNELLITAPEIALGDESIDQNEGQWRLLPLPGSVEGARRSLAVQVSAQYRYIVEELREYGILRNLPVIVNVHAAPLEAMAAVPKLLPETALGNGIFLFQYESFTYLFATGPRKELLLVRPLLHRSGQHLSPAEISDVVKSTAALLNIRTPTIAYVSLAGMAPAQLDELLLPVREENPGNPFHMVSIGQIDFLETIPDHRFEFWVASNPPKGNEVSKTVAFSELRKSFATQDFYGPARAEKELMPNRSDLKLLKASHWIQRIAILVVLAFSGWTGADFIAKMRSEAWELDAEMASGMEEKVMTLKKEKREWEHWSSLLTKRSEGWLALETLLELFPDTAGVILKEANYKTEAIVETKESSKHVGLKRLWTVSGFANPEVATQLPNLGSRTRVAQILNQIAEANHADYLSVKEDTRDVQVTLQQKQGAMTPSFEFPAKVARHFRTSFDLNITQSLSSGDNIALTTLPIQSE